MTKVVLLASFLLLFFVAASAVNASILVINKQGEVIWRVLSEESNGPGISGRSYMVVKEVANTEPLPDASVSLTKDGEKISLVVSTDKEKKELDVSGWKDDLIEIEERPEVQQIKIGIEGKNFSLEQKGIVAITDFPISIDAKSATLSALTPTGNQYISILPFQAVESAIRARLISNLSQDKRIFLVEEGKELAYKVEGEKIINIFNVFSFSIPVTTQVSAATGEVLIVEQPKWFRILNFLFV